MLIDQQINPKISIIVPIYNSELTIKRCVNSLISQTYSNIEILLIDDGSTDGTRKICNELQDCDERVFFYKKNNGGVSSARNFGINHAIGSYIGFVDSDDWVEPNYIESLIRIILLTKCDIFFCTYFKEYGTTTAEFEFDDIKERQYIIQTYKDFLPTENHLWGNCWGALYSSSIINGLHFDEDVYNSEDALFVAKIIKKYGKIGRYNCPLYHYWLNQRQSLTLGNFNDKRFSIFLAYERMIGLFKDNRKACKIRKSRYSEAALFFLIEYFNDPLFMRNFFYKTHRRYLKYFFYIKRKTIHEKIQLLYFVFAPKIYICHLAKKGLIK